MLQSIGFWNPETVSKEKLLNKLYDNNRHWIQQKYQLGKLREPKTKQDEKSLPQYEDVRFNIQVEEHTWIASDNDAAFRSLLDPTLCMLPYFLCFGSIWSLCIV